MKSTKRLLVVDDESNIAKILEMAFSKEGFEVKTAASGEEALTLMSFQSFDCVLSDVTMPGMTGYELQDRVKNLNPNLPFILMTAFGTIPQAVAAIRNGAFEYVTKPFDLNNLKKIVNAATSDQRQKKSTICGTTKTFIAESPQMREIKDLVTQVAASKATVLITGESGVGKEVVARAIHDLSPRSTNQFVAVSCAALPDTLIESELFGYEKGAFTGANSNKQGKFELADNGTLFLDEIGEIPALTQVKLLRVLQEREIERLGASNPTKVDVRLVTATNRDLQAEVERGTFRLDLLYRLQVVEIWIPPLRERLDEIASLSQHFIASSCKGNARPLMTLSEDALAHLVSYSWPGNVRELENAVERAIVLAPPNEIVLTAKSFAPMRRVA